MEVLALLLLILLLVVCWFVLRAQIRELKNRVYSLSSPLPSSAGALVLVIGIALFLAYCFGYMTAGGRSVHKHPHQFVSEQPPKETQLS